MSKKTVFVPKSKSYSFPPQCIVCLESAGTFKDLTISGTYHKSVGEKFIANMLNQTIRNIPYCDQHAEKEELPNNVDHAEREKVLNKVDGVLEKIAGTVGVVVLIILLFLMYEKYFSNHWAYFLFCTVSGIAAGAAIYFLIKALMTIFYPDIWQLKLGELKWCLLGAQAELVVGSMGASDSPVIKGMILTFSNAEYSQLFCEANGLKES